MIISGYDCEPTVHVPPLSGHSWTHKHFTFNNTQHIKTTKHINPHLTHGFLKHRCHVSLKLLDDVLLFIEFTDQFGILTHLVAIACLFVFGSYWIKHWYDVRRTVGKVSRARDWRLMDVHRVRVLEDGKAVRQRETFWRIKWTGDF